MDKLNQEIETQMSTAEEDASEEVLNYLQSNRTELAKWTKRVAWHCKKVNELDEQVNKAFKVANNAIYFDDSSDYLSALYEICLILNPKLDSESIGLSYMEE